ncbi:MAG: DUF2520 domain-containing protein [Deltaproteobacteria bacterium]|nr:DUF2520 domain-containing protein [Deltaproteobacteria bacterium]
MRQVPRYAIIGDGRIARHFTFYFRLKNIPYMQWARKGKFHDLKSVIEQATHVLLLISDSAVDSFIANNSEIRRKVAVHFSGSLLCPYAFTAHPLQTFAHDLYDLASYERIPFVIEEEGPEFSELLPFLPNPHYRIRRAAKAFYHSLCVMANNFTTILWHKFFESLKELNIPREAAEPFLERTFLNLLQNPSHALTGPFARKDWPTLQRDLNALKGDPFYGIFREFIKAQMNDEWEDDVHEQFEDKGKQGSETDFHGNLL